MSSSDGASDSEGLAGAVASLKGSSHALHEQLRGGNAALDGTSEAVTRASARMAELRAMLAEESAGGGGAGLCASLAILVAAAVAFATAYATIRMLPAPGTSFIAHAAPAPAAAALAAAVAATRMAVAAALILVRAGSSLAVGLVAQVRPTHAPTLTAASFSVAGSPAVAEQVVAVISATVAVDGSLGEPLPAPLEDLLAPVDGGAEPLLLVVDADASDDEADQPLEEPLALERGSAAPLLRVGNADDEEQSLPLHVSPQTAELEDARVEAEVMTLSSANEQPSEKPSTLPAAAAQAEEDILREVPNALPVEAEDAEAEAMPFLETATMVDDEGDELVTLESTGSEDAPAADGQPAVAEPVTADYDPAADVAGAEVAVDLELEAHADEAATADTDSDPPAVPMAGSSAPPDVAAATDAAADNATTNATADAATDLNG